MGIVADGVQTSGKKASSPVPRWRPSRGKIA